MSDAPQHRSPARGRTRRPLSSATAASKSEWAHARRLPVRENKHRSTEAGRCARPAGGCHGPASPDAAPLNRPSGTTETSLLESPSATRNCPSVPSPTRGAPSSPGTRALMYSPGCVVVLAAGIAACSGTDRQPGGFSPVPSAGGDSWSRLLMDCSGPSSHWSGGRQFLVRTRLSVPPTA